LKASIFFSRISNLQKSLSFCRELSFPFVYSGKGTIILNDPRSLRKSEGIKGGI
jgi:hypothetical protein